MFRPIFIVAVCFAVTTDSLAAGDHLVHSFRRVTLTTEFWSEGAGYGDFNRDGQVDVISGPYWYAGPDFQQRYEFYPAAQTHTNETSAGAEEIRSGWSPRVYSDNFFAFAHDFNADGWPDILVIGFPGKEASWFTNPRGQAGHWKRHVVFDAVDNESPYWTDLTGDGMPELICNHEGYFGYAQPDWKNPDAKWTFQRISSKGNWTHFNHGLGVGDVNGDGRLDVIEKGGWWEQPASLDGDPVWKLHPFDFGPGGAQMHAYDVNGDGLNDIVTSLVAHGFGLAWFEQVREGNTITFRRHIIMNQQPHENRYGLKVSMLHAVALADMDGDGLKDIVTGKRFWLPGYRRETEQGSPSPLYWFKLTSSGAEVNFVPYLIDPTVGLGVQLEVADLNGDGRPDVIAANKQGTFVFLQEAKKVSAEEWAKAQPKPATLRHAAAGIFEVGVGISDRISERTNDWPLLLAQFSQVTPENCMKPVAVQPAAGRFNFEHADAFVNFATQQQLGVVGHCLVWAKDDRTPAWFYHDGDQPASRELLLERMRQHIETVVGRYRGRIAAWDVVNEALDDGTNYLRPSGWSAACGEEFIAKAFEYTHRADPQARLIYNDYNNELPAKREKTIRLIRSLRSHNVPLHAIGLQGHYELDRVPLADLEITLVAMRELGVKVVISELDIDVIPRGRWWADGGKHREEMAKLNPYRDSCPPEILKRQAEQYAQLFRLFRQYADVIERVSFWNLHDGQSWLNDFPWQRVNYPLLFDREGQPKPAFAAVMGELAQ